MSYESNVIEDSIKPEYTILGKIGVYALDILWESPEQVGFHESNFISLRPKVWEILNFE